MPQPRLEHSGSTRGGKRQIFGGVEGFQPLPEPLCLPMGVLWVTAEQGLIWPQAEWGNMNRFWEAEAWRGRGAGAIHRHVEALQVHLRVLCGHVQVHVIGIQQTSECRGQERWSRGCPGEQRSPVHQSVPCHWDKFLFKPQGQSWQAPTRIRQVYVGGTDPAMAINKDG